mgnify:CR=1 FL=1
MKKWKNYLLSILAVAGFVACSDDDPGMAPVIDGKDVSVEIKRDTADVYKISLPITSEEGLSKVSLIDNATNKAIDEQTSFSNPNNHTYTYDFDLTPYTDNTVVMLTLKIEDKAGQIVNKKITLTVKKFSELDVRFATEGTMSTWFENCNVKLTVVRGLIPLKELQIYVGETLSSTYDLSLDAEQSKYDLNVHVEGLQDGNNTVKVVVIDNKDQKFEKSIVINRTGQKTWKDLAGVGIDGLSAYGALPINFNSRDDFMGEGGDYPEDGRVYRIGMIASNMMSGYYINFEYGNNDMVSKVIYNYMNMMGAGSLIEYNYEYNSNSEVTKVTRSEDGGNLSDYITNIVYESGSIVSYKIENEEYIPQYAEKEGEMVRVDLLNADLSGYTCDFTTKRGNPLYMDKLPALIPLNFNGLDFSLFFYNPYFFETVNDGTTVKQTYTVSDIVYDSEKEANKQTITWMKDEQELSFIIFYNE